MPILAALFVEGLVAIASFLVSYFTEKVAVATAATAIFTALLTAFYVGARVLLAGIASQISGSVSPMFGAGIQMAISPRAAAMITAYVGFWAACELYKVKTTLINIWAGRL